MKIKTYVINLKESVDRREKVLAETQKYPCMDVEWVEAVNGKTLSKEEIYKWFDCEKFPHYEGRYVFPGEIGCTLSHQECYRRLLNSEDDIALVLEDDVCFFDQENVEFLLQEITRKMSPEIPCMTTLTRHNIYYRKEVDKIGKYSLYRIRKAYGTCAYLINRKAAGKILSISDRPYFVADNFLLMNRYKIYIQGIHPILAMGASELNKIETTVWEDGNIVRNTSLQYWIHWCGNRLYHRFLQLLQILKHRIYSEEEMRGIQSDKK